MRIAVLILASHAPRALFATASYFAPSDVDIFVHIDDKVDLAQYLAQAGPWPPRVKFLEARRRVYWGGFSMVEATLDLLRAAFRAGPYDRYVFISDNSLPVQSLDGFFAVLAAREDILQIKKAQIGHELNCYDKFYLTDDPLFDYRRGGLPLRPIEGDVEDQILQMQAAKARGKKPVTLFNGQASWALAPDSARLVLEAADNDPWWVESCRFGMFSDEFFFSTLVAAKYPDGLDDPPTYSDSFRRAPRTFRHAVDLPFDMQPHFLFLRKIAPDFAVDLPETCLRLYAGVRHMLAHDPAVRAERVVAVSQAGAPHLHLMAPIEDDPAWGRLGNWRGRRYRRLLADAAIWRLRAPAEWRALTLSLTCVIGGSDAILPHAAFEIDGQRAPLTACDLGYRAEFENIARPFDTITLHLPPGPRPDLFVAVLPAD